METKSGCQSPTCKEINNNEPVAYSHRSFYSECACPEATQEVICHTCQLILADIHDPVQAIQMADINTILERMTNDGDFPSTSKDIAHNIGDNDNSFRFFGSGLVSNEPPSIGNNLCERNAVAIDKPLAIARDSSNELPAMGALTSAYLIQDAVCSRPWMADFKTQNRCIRHPRRIAWVFCNSCSQPTCSYCSGTFHWDHDLSLMDDVLTTILGGAHMLLEIVDSKIQEIRWEIGAAAIKWTQAQKRATSTAVQIKIKEDFRLMWMKLMQVELVRLVRNETLQRRIDDLEKLLLDMEQIRHAVAKGLHLGTDADLLQYGSKVMRCKEEMARLLQQSSLQTDYAYAYVPKNVIPQKGFDKFRGTLDDMIGGATALFHLRGLPHPLFEFKETDLHKGTCCVSYELGDATSSLQETIALRDYLKDQPVQGASFQVTLCNSRDCATISTAIACSEGPGIGEGQFYRPWGICCDADGHVVVSDRCNGRIQVFDRDLNFLYAFGSIGQAPGQLNRPAGVAVDNTRERIVVADKDNHRVQIFSFRGQPLMAFGQMGDRNGQFHYPWGVAFHEASRRICVTDSKNGRVQFFSEDGEFMSVFSAFSFGCDKDRYSPRGVAFDKDGNVIITDFGGHRLVVLYSKWRFYRPVTCMRRGSNDIAFQRPQGIAVDHNGNYVVADSKKHQIHIFRPNGTHIHTFGCQGTRIGQFDRPTDLCASNDNRVYVVDSENHRVQAFLTSTGF